jgi:hypothetical protein
MRPYEIFAYILILLSDKNFNLSMIFSVNAMAKTFAILAQGSSFMHGSNTNNGGSADVRINDLFAYVAYQAAVRNLGEIDNPIIHDLNYTKR